MRRHEFIAGLGGALATPLTARAQKPGKVVRIGMLETRPVEQSSADQNAFRQALREYGYVEGQNLTIEYRSADGRPGHFASLAIELVRLNVDLILTRVLQRSSRPRVPPERFP